MAVYAIGDVQGCHSELERLLDAVRFDPAADRLWFAGDLVNRGPGSLEALRYVRSLGEAAVTVLGNHDLHLLALAETDAPQPRKYDTLKPVLEAPDAGELLGWLRERPLLHYDADLDWLLIHAGLPPQWDRKTAGACAREVETALRGEKRRKYLKGMYGDRPRRWRSSLTGNRRLRFITNCLTRLRYCDAKGRIDLEPTGAPGTQPKGLMPWFRVPGRKSEGLRIVCGHWAAMGLRVEGGVHAIDTGCVWGGRLTALRLDGAGEMVSVPCAGAG
ncbi:MAG: symmetrical bis(5'-nucleosyl)-tetraphosphatase [Gammaproteobacteria bacterium]